MADPQSVVAVTNRGDKPFVQQYARVQYRIEPGQTVAVPWDAMVLWFGNPSGPPELRAYVSHDFKPAAVWTRLCRGAALLALDTLYVPRSLHPAYSAAAKGAVRLLGGRDQLDEDNDYFSFSGRPLAPLRGLGLFTLTFFLPGLLYASWRCLRPARELKKRAAYLPGH